MGIPDITQIAALQAQIVDQSERINRLKELRDVNAALEGALREIADLPEEYISGKYAHEWLMSNPTRHAVTVRLVKIAKDALTQFDGEANAD